MDFGGNLSVVEPAIVLQIFNMSRLTGELKFITHTNVASFYFRDGELIFATIDTRRKKLGQFLIESGRLTKEQLGEALHEYLSNESQERIGHILIKKGFISYETLVDAIQVQMKEVVYEVLSWKDGHFVFFKDIMPRDDEILLDIKLDHLILEGLKRLDEKTRNV